MWPHDYKFANGTCGKREGIIVEMFVITSLRANLSFQSQEQLCYALEAEGGAHGEKNYCMKQEEIDFYLLKEEGDILLILFSSYFLF